MYIDALKALGKLRKIQDRKPRHPAAFFKKEFVKKTLKESGFKSPDELRRALHLTTEAEPEKDLIDLTWIRPAKPQLIKSLRELSLSRPKVLQKFFNSNKFMAWLYQNNFSSKSEFFEYMDCLGGRRERGQAIYQYQKLADILWPKPSPETILEKLKNDLGQKTRPSDANSFFRSQKLLGWCKENNFHGTTEFLESIDCIRSKKTYVSKDGKVSPRRFIDIEKASQKIWERSDAQKICQAIRENFGHKRPTKLKSFFTSPRFRNSLAQEHNILSLVELANILGVKTQTQTRERTDRPGHHKIETRYDLNKLASKIWQTPSLPEIRQMLKQDIEEHSQRGPYRYFNSKEFKNWLLEHNFANMVEFAKAINVPATRHAAADRSNGKAFYHWKKMLEALKK